MVLVGGVGVGLFAIFMLLCLCVVVWFFFHDSEYGRLSVFLLFLLAVVLFIVFLVAPKKSSTPTDELIDSQQSYRIAFVLIESLCLFVVFVSLLIFVCMEQKTTKIKSHHPIPNVNPKLHAS